MCHTVRTVHSPDVFSWPPRRWFAPIKYVEKEAVITHVVVELLELPRADFAGGVYKCLYGKRLPALQAEGVHLEQTYPNGIIATLYEDRLHDRQRDFSKRLVEDLSRVLWNDQADAHDARHKTREGFVAEIRTSSGPRRSAGRPSSCCCSTRPPTHWTSS